MHRFNIAKSCVSLTGGVIIFASAFLLLSNTEASAAYLEREYKDMDSDGDGYVNLNELKFYETKSAPAFNEIDRDSNGRIEFREWATYRDRNYPFESRYRFKDRGHANRYKRFPGDRHRYYRYPYDPYPRFGLGFRFGYGTGPRWHRDRFYGRYGYDWHPYRGRFW